LRIFWLSVLLALLVGFLGVTPARAAGVCYVKWNASGTTHDGTSWTNAYTDLQSSLGASPCTEIWVAAGTYKPSVLTVPPDVRSATFLLKNGVALYGGFAGTETLRSERMYMTNVSILSGDIDNNDNQTPIITNIATVTGNKTNSYHVVTAGDGTTSTAVLDGFTITAGYSDNGTDLSGGGLWIIGHSPNLSSPTLSNLTISGNYGGSNGGGGARLGSSTSTLTNITFSNNTSTGAGGGLEISNASSAVVLTNVTFSGNSTSTTASSGGGVFLTTGVTATLNDVTFSGNIAGPTGGSAIGTNPSATLTINNSIIWGNTP